MKKEQAYLEKKKSNLVLLETNKNKAKLLKFKT